jgi:2-C-methyl-D-erythritol 4-phosphate cytidylyltransferase
MEGHEPKAFLPLKGKPMLVHAIQPFEECSRIESVYPVLRKGDVPSWHKEIIRRFPFKKTKNPVPGGLRRQDSVRLGLESIQEAVDIILIHDGARPLLEAWMLEKLLDTMEGIQAAVLAVPAKETIKVVSHERHVLETPSRETLWHVQTPQAFDYRIIVEAHHRGLAEGITATDDSMLVERLGVPIAVVEGSYRNIKVTTREDLIIAQALIEDRERYRPDRERGQ